MPNASNNNLQQIITNGFQEMLDISLSVMKPVIAGFTQNFSSVSRSVSSSPTAGFQIPAFNIKSADCCVPKQECPPHCIAGISRTAMAGERIIVAFIIRNSGNKNKTWKIGVRELKDENGNLAPTQPYLNKNGVTLDAGRSEKILMTVDLAQFANGERYYTEIVIREKEFNQNICFTLNLVNEAATIVEPREEDSYRLKWQSWDSHYYCELPDRTPNYIAGEKT